MIIQHWEIRCDACGLEYKESEPLQDTLTADVFTLMEIAGWHNLEGRLYCPVCWELKQQETPRSDPKIYEE